MRRAFTKFLGISTCLTFIISCSSEEPAGPRDSSADSTSSVIEPSPDPQKLVLFMSPTGNDSNSGLVWDKPVATFDRVQDILFSRMPESDVEIHLHHGTYKSQSITQWTFVNGKKIIFTPINFSKERPIFDGEGRQYWFRLEAGSGTNTNLYFRYIKVMNYKNGVYLSGDRENEGGGWNGNNHFYGMYFLNIGSKHAGGENYGLAAIGMINSRNNVVTNCHFVNLENRDNNGDGSAEDECSHLHAVYMAHYSSNNRISWNRIERVCGDPIKVRDESNWNDVRHNRFIRTGQNAFYVDAPCTRPLCQGEDDEKCCTKSTIECPSYGNEFRDNDCNKGYSGGKISLFRYIAPDDRCGPLPERRLRTSGNVNY